MKKYSELTFKDLTENLAFVKIVYNGKVIFNDYRTDPGESIEHLKFIQKTYAAKKVYSMKIKVVDFHHCILYIRGEK